MDEKFQAAIKFVLENEGGVSFDHAGWTNFGITKPILDSIGLPSDEVAIKSLTRDMAIDIWKQVRWDKYEYNRISDVNVATKVFDLSVNMGPSQAHKIAQRAVRSCYHDPIEDDGILGPISIAAINQVPAGLLNVALRSEAAGIYRQIHAKDPDKYGAFIKGWLNRAYR